MDVPNNQNYSDNESLFDSGVENKSAIVNISDDDDNKLLDESDSDSTTLEDSTRPNSSNLDVYDSEVEDDKKEESNVDNNKEDNNTGDTNKEPEQQDVDTDSSNSNASFVTLSPGRNNISMPRDYYQKVCNEIKSMEEDITRLTNIESESEEHKLTIKSLTHDISELRKQVESQKIEIKDLSDKKDIIVNSETSKGLNSDIETLKKALSSATNHLHSLEKRLTPLYEPEQQPIKATEIPVDKPSEPNNPVLPNQITPLPMDPFQNLLLKDKNTRSRTASKGSLTGNRNSQIVTPNNSPMTGRGNTENKRQHSSSHRVQKKDKH